jgi:RNA-binding protein YhbY
MALLQLQIGKNGLTQEFLENLRVRFLTAENARISVLKSGTRDRVKLKEWNQTILDFLGKNFKSTVIGYTIVLRKLRKAVK